MSYIGDKEYADIYALSQDFSARFRVFSSLFLNRDEELLQFIKTADDNKYAQIIALIPLKKDIDRYLYRVLMILNPHSLLQYHTYCFSSYAEIAEKIIKFTPKIDVYLLDLLTKGIIVDHMKRINFEKSNPQIFAKVLEFTKFCERDPKIAYFRFAFYFHGPKNIKYDGFVYSSFQNFVGTLLNSDKVSDIADTLISDGFLVAWQIAAAGDDLSIFERYCHVVKVCEHKKLVYERELKIEEKIK